MSEAPVHVAHHGGSGLGKQLGPLPLGGWLAVAAAGTVIGLYLRKRAAGTSLAGVDATAAPLTAPLPTGVGGDGATSSDTTSSGGGADQVDLALVEYLSASTQAILEAADRAAYAGNTSNTPTAPTGGTTTTTPAVATAPVLEPVAAPAPAYTAPAPDPVYSAPATAAPRPTYTTPIVNPVIPTALQSFDFVAPVSATGRALSTFDKTSQQKLLAGGTVVGGDGRIMKYDPASGTTYSTGSVR